MNKLIEPGSEFGRLFGDFKYTAFRLETRDQYRSPNEAKALEEFVAGKAVDLTWFQNWLSMIRVATAEGRTFRRVRVVTIPLTEYSRFGLYCAQYTNDAGEDIRYLSRDQAADLPDHDYWLFDSYKLIKMHFDDGDHFLGGEVIEDSTVVVQHNYWRDAAWHEALRRDDFATE